MIRPICLLDLSAAVNGQSLSVEEIARRMPYLDDIHGKQFMTLDECEEWLKTNPSKEERDRVFLIPPFFKQSDLDDFIFKMKEHQQRNDAENKKALLGIDSIPQDFLNIDFSSEEVEIDYPGSSLKFKPLPAHFQINKRGKKLRRW